MIGSQATSLVVPPAYQVKSPFGANMGGVSADFIKLKNESKCECLSCGRCLSLLGALLLLCMYVVLMELIGQASERDPVPQPFCADDSWLTVGITGGDSSQQIGSVGLSWSDWTSHKGINDNDCGVFWMNPLKANQSASYEHNPIMLGQVMRAYN